MKRIGKIVATSGTILILIVLLGVATSRTVRAAVVTLVTVANTLSNPVPATDVGPQQPYVTSCQNATDNGLEIACFTSVPSGKRFVVETVSTYLSVGSGFQPIETEIQIQTGTSFGRVFINVPFAGDQSNNNSIFYGSQSLKGYIENAPGVCFAKFNNVTGGVGIYCSMSGYLVDIP
jgi:hypothetical protein